MMLATTPRDFDPNDFSRRHIGPSPEDEREMLSIIGVSDVGELISQTVPDAIRQAAPLALPPGISETEALQKLRIIADKNKIFTSLIGQGYYGTILPPVIQRNVLENPAWYTAYTPYQPEISQGRLEALLNFQTMVTDLTGLATANASMLDEATAAADHRGDRDAGRAAGHRSAGGRSRRSRRSARRVLRPAPAVPGRLGRRAR